MSHFQLKQTSSFKAFDGEYRIYEHNSAICDCPMTFSVYIPPQATQKPLPLMYWLSGLTCTEENFRVKAGAARYAAELGIIMVIPDTSPRGKTVPDDDNYYLGQGAGFYLNATETPWNHHFRMYDYVVKELPQLVQELGILLVGRQGIFGHSMGGHGALSIAFKNPEMFTSVSAFSPVANPSQSIWGQAALETYLGKHQASWREYDSCCLLEDYKVTLPILVDQGDADPYYPQELRTESLINTCQRQGVEATIRIQQGYEHSYHFVATFIGEHLAWHASYLNR